MKIFFNSGNSLIIAVYAEDEEGRFTENKDFFIGFSYGFVGVKDKEVGFREINNLLYYSQYVGVRRDFQDYRLGILIKEFQPERKADGDVRDLYYDL